MAELAIADDLTDETRAELDTIEKGVPDLERQIRAAMVGLEEEERAAQTTETDSPDAELRERIELRGKAQLTNFLLAAARGRIVDGAEAELCAAAGVQGIPLELWDLPRPAEQRDITPAPGTVGINLDPIRPAVFANSIAPRLGVQMPRVMSGTYATGTITTSQTATPLAKSAAAVGAVGAISVTTATPKRISARLELTLEDIAAVGQANFESDPPGKPGARAVGRAGRSGRSTGTGRRRTWRGSSSGCTGPSAPGAAVADIRRLRGPPSRVASTGFGRTRCKEVAIVCRRRTPIEVSRPNLSGTASAEMPTWATRLSPTMRWQHFGGFWTNKRMPAKTASNIQASDPVPHGQQR